ncbi:MAG: Na+/H+ antiporter subunit E [Gammaproteobacteria bacterium]|nr:Na+/H+ antiporter subunit E [Gammaproteobacteria bacterium]
MKKPSSSPPPVLTTALAASWLLLNQTLALGQIAFAALLALALARTTSALRPLRPRLRRMRTVPGLLLMVLTDITRSSFNVARIVLGLVGNRPVHAGFLDIPLELRDPHGLAALATIITATPGTVWVGLAPDGHSLTLHVLDLRDGIGWIHLIKTRYEQPLIRIFE